MILICQECYQSLELPFEVYTDLKSTYQIKQILQINDVKSNSNSIKYDVPQSSCSILGPVLFIFIY